MSQQPIYLKTGDSLLIQTVENPPTYPNPSCVNPSCPNETKKPLEKQSELYYYIFGLATGISMVFLLRKK